MVLDKAQNTLSSLKERPKDEKKVIAGGIAIAVIAVIFLGWALYFFKKIQRGGVDLQLGGGAQDEFLPSSVRNAQDDFQKRRANDGELQAIREESINKQTTDQQIETSGSAETSADPFSPSGSSN